MDESQSGFEKTAGIRPYEARPSVDQDIATQPGLNAPSPASAPASENPQRDATPTMPAQQIIINNNNQVAATPVAIFVTQKSVLAAFLLTFFFGPLGMFYSTVLGAVIMLLVSIVVAMFTLGAGLIVTWPICVIWGTVAASNHNKNLASNVVLQSIRN